MPYLPITHGINSTDSCFVVFTNADSQLFTTIYIVGN